MCHAGSGANKDHGAKSLSIQRTGETISLNGKLNMISLSIVFIFLSNSMKGGDIISTAADEKRTKRNGSMVTEEQK